MAFEIMRGEGGGGNRNEILRLGERICEEQLFRIVADETSYQS